MASYYGAARTNYFRVRDKDIAEDWAKTWGFEMCPGGNDPSVFCFLSEHEDGWPPSRYDEEGEEIAGLPLIEQFNNIAAPDEIVIMMEAWSEKLRYLVGYAAAIRNGEVIEISLHDIYDLAANKWGVKPTTVEL